MAYLRTRREVELLNNKMNESGHFYDLKGNAVFEVPNKSKGGMRPTTISDAKKLGLLPSVTTIFKALAKPELDRWKQVQVLTASMTLPRLKDESDDSFMARVMEDAFVQVDDAADLGTRIHAAIEDFFQGKPYDKSLEKYILPVKKWALDSGVKFLSHEVRVVNPIEGYAGTTDAVISAIGREGVGILDFKTRKSKPNYPMKPWSTEPMQIAAYGAMKNASFGVNVFISSTEEGRVEASWYDAYQMTREFEAFKHVCHVWRHFNSYTIPVS